MPLENCKQCSNPFERIGPALLCFHCLSNERKDYQRYYKLISPLLFRLDFNQLGQLTEKNGILLREVLLFRLGGGEVKELPKWKKGGCYLCSERLLNKESPEPICLTCLNLINKAIGTMESQVKQLSSTSFLKPLIANDPPASSGGSLAPSFDSANSGPAKNCPCCGNSAQEAVCKSCFEFVSMELKAYKKHFGEIPADILAEYQDTLVLTSTNSSQPPSSAGSTATPVGETAESSGELSDSQKTLQASVAEVDEFLKILDSDDEDPFSLPDNEGQDEPPFPNESNDIKRFGFKRTKMNIK
ncbi:MAG: hypothetical protein K2X66_16325 [Cyanobacteria bacterium]|nr:hypothetical protein [Cyanobacteriota bacterium]